MYKVSWLTYLVGRLLVKIAHFALVNILAGRGLVPELLQGEASPERMAAEIERLLADRGAREAQLARTVQPFEPSPVGIPAPSHQGRKHEQGETPHDIPDPPNGTRIPYATRQILSAMPGRLERSAQPVPQMDQDIQGSTGEKIAAAVQQQRPKGRN